MIEVNIRQVVSLKKKEEMSKKMKVNIRQVVSIKEEYVVEQLEEPPIIYGRYRSWYGIKELFRGNQRECKEYVSQKGLQEI